MPVNKEELDEWLIQAVPITNKIKIVDIGASPIGGRPPYKALLHHKLATVTGFEPNPEQFQKLEKSASADAQFYPYAIGDGTQQRLYITHHRGFTSTLKPELLTHSKIENFAEATTVVKEIDLKTTRLDDIDELERIDLLKIDIQGGELAVFENGNEKLRNTLFVHTETAFIPLYVDQPLFSDQDRFLRNIGMLLYGFYSSHKYLPITDHDLSGCVDLRGEIGQLLDADAVFIKDFRKLDKLTNEEIKRMIMISHFVYNAASLVTTCLELLVARNAIDSAVKTDYWNSIRNNLSPPGTLR